MEYILRDYQQRAKEDIKKYLSSDSNKKVIIVQPCAAGKSLLIAETASMTDKPVLVIQPSKELLTQNYGKFIDLGFKASIYSASKGIKEIGHITYATPGSIKNEAKRFKELGVEMICIDECHLGTKVDGMLDKIIKEIKPKKVLGFTATPCNQHQNMNGTQMKMMNRYRNSIMNDIIHVTQVRELVDNGYWSKVEIKEIKFNESKLRLNSSNTDFTLSSVMKSMEDNNTTEKIIKTYDELIKQGRKKILIFVPSILQAEQIANAHKDIQVVTSTTKPKERDFILEQFNKGKVKGVVNVATLGTGYDNPLIDGLIMGTPTRSYISFYQVYGRCVRIHPDKNDCVLVDLVGNVKRFGRPEELEIIDYPGHGWGMFFQDYLLTGVNLDSKFVTKEWLDGAEERKREAEEREKLYKERAEERENFEKEFDGSNPKLWFGKHKGEYIKNIPPQYLEWIVTNKEFKWFGKDEIIEKTQNAIKDLLLSYYEKV